MDRIEPRIHDEIKDYKEKFYNFTIRQWLFAILIVIIVVPLYLFLSPIIGSDLTGWIVILVAGPIGFIGFIPIQGLSAEKMIFFGRETISISQNLFFIRPKLLILFQFLKKKQLRKKKQRFLKKTKRNKKN